MTGMGSAWTRGRPSLCALGGHRGVDDNDTAQTNAPPEHHRRSVPSRNIGSLNAFVGILNAG